MSDFRIAATPSAAAGAYARVQSSGGSSSGVGNDAAVQGGGFGDTLSKALEGVVNAGHGADAAAAKGIAGEGNMTDIVMAVSRAQLALQSTTAIRDKVVQAYQDVMKMSI